MHKKYSIFFKFLFNINFSTNITYLTKVENLCKICEKHNFKTSLTQKLDWNYGYYSICICVCGCNAVGAFRPKLSKK